MERTPETLAIIDAVADELRASLNDISQRNGGTWDVTDPNNGDDLTFKWRDGEGEIFDYERDRRIVFTVKVVLTVCTPIGDDDTPTIV